MFLDTGEYTQQPFPGSLAARQCGLINPDTFDLGQPDPGEMAIYLVTGVDGGVEGDLGFRSEGSTRPNDNPCP